MEDHFFRIRNHPCRLDVDSLIAAINHKIDFVGGSDMFAVGAGFSLERSYVNGIAVPKQFIVDDVLHQMRVFNLTEVKSSIAQTCVGGVVFVRIVKDLWRRGDFGIIREMKRNSTSKKKKPSFGTGWVTTDDEERALRRYRAEIEGMTVRFVGEKDLAPFGDYEVASCEGRKNASYRVELRSLERFSNTCSCPDFLKNGLGTCKHIERVLIRAKRKAKGAVQSSCGEIFMSPDMKSVCFQQGEAMPKSAAESVRRHFAGEGRLRLVSALGVEALLATCERTERKTPGVVRVSPAVAAFARELRFRESHEAAVGCFASEMASCDGNWPFLKTSLYPYQVEGALHLASKGRAILADEMGLGKTVQAIAAALLLREISKIRRVLVVVPASLKGEWADQIALFSNIKTELLSGPRRERLARYSASKAFFLVANYEQIIRDGKDVEERFKPDLVVLDEAQRIKNWNTKTAQTLKKLHSRFAFVLTGTPLENRIDEFYSIAELVDPSLFGSLFRFNRAYYRFDEKGKSSGMQNLDDLHEKASTIMLRRRKDMVEDELPRRTDKNYFVEMTDEQRIRYCEYEDKVARLCSRAKTRPLTKDEMKLLQQYLSCMRILCDTCYILDQNIRDSPKIDEAVAVLNDIFSSDPSRKVVVFSEWVRMLELLEARLVEENIGFAVHTGNVQQERRREELKRFKTEPECRVLLSSESGGVGLNLQNASVVMNLDLPWNPAKLEQRIARAWRKKQKRDVLVVNLVAEQTIEHRMIGTLKFKQGLADLVLDARGDAADFESEKSKNAFLARVTSLMESQEPAVNSADGTANSASFGAENSNGVSSGEGHEPEDIEKTLTPETLALLSKLEKMGLVTLGDEARKRLSMLSNEESSCDLHSAEYARVAKKRMSVAKSALEKAQRLARMGEVLDAGGFIEEAMSPFCDAVVLASAAVLFANEQENGEMFADVPDEVKPLSYDDSQRIEKAMGLLSDDARRTLDFAMKNRIIPNSVLRVQCFIDECRSAYLAR